MKKFFCCLVMILVTSVANAQIEYYTSVKMGLGDTTIYVNDDDKFGDYWVKWFEEHTGLSGYRYGDSGLMWEISAAVGLDWSPSKMYVKQTPYEWFHLRLEGEFGYNNYHENGKLRRNYAVTDTLEVKYDYFFALANGYAGFRIDSITPYFGLGIGYCFGNEEVRVDDASDSVDNNGIIYALHLGVGYKYSDITTFDLGARRVYAPAEDDGMSIFDTIRLGVRFRI